MNKIFTIFVLFVFALLISLGVAPDKILASENSSSNADVSDEITSKKLDKEAQILQKYLAKCSSPMQDHAQDFIDAAKLYNLDWKMLPAIAGVESTFGKHIPGGYNAYGWGVYGTNVIYFTSWTDGIFTVAKGLREGYLNKGLMEPYAINKVYAASPTWGKNVTYFMNDLEKFANNYAEDFLDIGFSRESTEPKIAAISANPARSSLSEAMAGRPVIR